MSQTTRFNPLEQELMAELIKERPNRELVRDHARKLGFKNAENIDALMAEMLEKSDRLRPKSKKRPSEVTP